MSNSILLRRRHVGAAAVQNNIFFIKTREALTITFTQKGIGVLSYSLDGSLWTAFVSGQPTPTISPSTKVYIKGNLSPNLTTTDNMGIGRFSVSGQFDIGGCPLSMLQDENFDLTDPIPTKAFSFLFYSCTGLISAENMIMPSGAAGDYCCRNMFVLCGNLIAAPAELPSMTLGEKCYETMFGRCNLTTAPRLPAKNSAIGCYYQMFRNNSNLTYIYCMLENFATDCTFNWMLSPSATGVFVKKTGVSWGTGTSGIPSGWTIEEV